MRHLTKAHLLVLFTMLCEAALLFGLIVFIADACITLPPGSLPSTALRGGFLVGAGLLIAVNIPSLVAAVVGAVLDKLA